jgi:hypothetical protein
MRGETLLDFLLLCVFVLVNFFALRWTARQLVADGQWLRKPEEREEILREFALDNLGRLWNPYQRDGLTSNPLFRVLSWVLLIGVILWADRFAIHQQWPWLISR